jgi:hypothetical protein
LRDRSVIGKLVAFGLGGVLVEVMKDITFRLAPVSKKGAVDGIGAGAEILRGAAPTALITALADILQKFQLVNDFPDILEVDLNPILPPTKGGTAVDVRIKRRAWATPTF